MRGEHPDAGGTLCAERLRDADQRAARGDQVIDDDRVHTVDVTDDALLADDVVFRAPLVHKRDRQIQQPRHVADPLRPAHVRRHDHGIRQIELSDVIDDELFGRQVIDRNIEEALDGIGMQVERDHPVGAGQRDDIGHEFG